MKYTINSLYQYLYTDVHNVYNVFKNFFGEDYVDLHYNIQENNFKRNIINYLVSLHIGVNYSTANETEFEISDDILTELKDDFQDVYSCIYVWWPKVTVTNEYNKSIHIQDLYAKIDISLDGRIPYECIGFSLNRATYDKIQFLCNYMHSHIRNIPKDNFALFNSPCLGTGPIRNTIASLKNECSEIFWMLFCQELNNYVSVESLKGGPWTRLESVGALKFHDLFQNYNFTSKNIDKFIQLFNHNDLKNFIRYYLHKGHLAISYKDSKFICAMPYHEYMIDISNCFIDFFNKNMSKHINSSKCFSLNILNKVLFSNGKFYKNTQQLDSDNIDNYQNKLVLLFKGKEIRTKIMETACNSEYSSVTLLSQDIAMYILYNILYIINFKYNNEYKSKQSNSLGESNQPSHTTSVGQGFFYI